MSRIKIICTSTGCIEYAPKRYQEYDIDFIRVHLFLKGQEYLEGPDLDPHKFYAALEDIQDIKGNLPHTAMPTTEEVTSAFDKAMAEGYDEVIVIALSSYLGGTWNFIRLNAIDYLDKFKTITVVDAKITCFPEGLLAIKAAELVKQGKTVSEILQEIEWMKARQEFIGIAGKLDYMILNGRLKGGKAYLGKLMSICPVLCFNHDGELVPMTNCIGINKAIMKGQEILKNIIGDRDSKDYILYRVYTGKSLQPRQIKYDEKNNFKMNHEEMVMSTVTGCHVGPWVIGYCYTPIRREDEQLPDVPDYYYEQNGLQK